MPSGGWEIFKNLKRCNEIYCEEIYTACFQQDVNRLHCQTEIKKMK